MRWIQQRQRKKIQGHPFHSNKAKNYLIISMRKCQVKKTKSPTQPILIFITCDSRYEMRIKKNKIIITNYKTQDPIYQCQIIIIVVRVQLRDDTSTLRLYMKNG